MNYQQANVVKDLAAPVNKVLERLEWEWKCPMCHSKGYVASVFCGCYLCKGEERKISYTWTPQVGEWCIWEDEVRLIENVSRGNVWCVYNELAVPTWEEANKVIPILEWERIEEAVKQTGHRIDICPGYECTIIGGGSKCLAKTLAKNRQEAVMKAVIELGKKMKK